MPRSDIPDSRVAEIPADIMAAAERASEQWKFEAAEDYAELCLDFARAILAERERCARIADSAGRAKLPPKDGLGAIMAKAMVRGGQEIASVIAAAIRKGAA